MVAERLKEKYDVTVLTSRALNYHTWEPELPEGECYENGIRVIRFNHPPKGSRKKLHQFNRKIRGRHLKQKLFRFIGEPKWFETLFPQVKVTEKDYNSWLTLQGPEMKELPDYLKKNKSVYSAYIFMTYLYYPTAIGVQAVPEKSILIPTMHDEPPAYFGIFQKVMSAPSWIFFNTKAEQEFSEKLFNIKSNNKEIVAVGIDPANNDIDVSVKEKFGIKSRYLIYVGRIDKAKGCDELLLFFQQFLKEHHPDIVLVLVGKNMMEEENYPSVLFTGFVTDEEKEQLMKQAEALVIPSKYESLSLVLLESFACNVPVIANGACQVLKDHIELSGGGWAYEDFQGFTNAVLSLLSDADVVKRKKQLGYQYVTENYTWNKVMQKFDDAIDDIEEKLKK
jgi:glycosyltransferase involved in cell wall biosynthesis